MQMSTVKEIENEARDIVKKLLKDEKKYSITEILMILKLAYAYFESSATQKVILDALMGGPKKDDETPDDLYA